MSETNKALVLKAFDTLFNHATMPPPRASGRPLTSSIALISLPAARVCST
jgi:hypothetical protein